jgi:hypothetical protein
MNKRFSWLVALPVVLLTNVSPASSENVLLAGFFDDLGDTVEDSVEKEVNGIFGSEDNSTEKPQREDRDLQEQRQGEIQTSENESIELEQSTNTNPASSDVKIGSAVNDLTLFCNLDYAKEVAEATSQSEIQSITSEARGNNCLSETKAGSELTYQYLGEEEYGIVLVGQNNNGQPYVGITQAKNIQTEEASSVSSSSETPSVSESSRENDESIDVGQFANISPTSPEMKTSYSTRDIEMFCIDYLERMRAAGSDFNEQMNVRSEAIKENCGRRSNAGSTFSYKYIGEKEDNNILIVKNFDGKDYYAIWSADWVVAETPEYVPESGQRSMAELKQLLDRKEGETYEEWFKRYKTVTYSEQITNEELRAYDRTLSQEDIQAYQTMVKKENDERGDMINEGIEVIVEDALTPDPETGGETKWCPSPTGGYRECLPGE